MKYASIVAAFKATPWAISPAGFELIRGILEAHASGAIISQEEKQTRALSVKYGAMRSAFNASGAAAQQSAALIPLHGAIMNRASGMMASAGISPQAFAAMVRAAADDSSVSQIVLDIDSPGGTVSGTQDAVQAVRYAASKKPVTAVANDVMASAAYWIASQATSIIASPAATIGSIGIISSHTDETALEAGAGVKTTYFRTGAKKALGQSSEAMTDEIAADWMLELQAYHDLFVSDVTAGRGGKITAPVWDDGAVWIGAEAVAVGLADGVGTLQSVLENLTAGKSSASRLAKGARMTPEELEALRLENPQAFAAITARGEERGATSERSRLATALGVAPEEVTAEFIAGLSRDATAGQAYRASLEARVSQASIAIKGADAGLAHATRMTKAFSSQPIADLEALVTDLEAERDAKYPSGRASVDSKDAPVRKAPVKFA